MGSLRFGDLSDASAMVLPPYHHQSFDPSSLYYASLQRYYSGSPIKTSLPTRDVDIPTEGMDNEPFMSVPASRPSPTACNKRKRDNVDDGSNLGQEQHVLNCAPSAIEDEPMNGEGTVLLSPLNEGPVSVKSLIPARIDERLDVKSNPAAEAEASCVEAKEELKCFPPQKCRRRGSPQLITDALTTNLPKTTTEQPTIDQFTYLLGIGWTRIASDTDVQKATRGWARYIENHYPLHAVEILLTSKALEDAVLVFARDGSMVAQQGFFLFREDLSEGRLVAYDWETCVSRLQASPLLFEGAEELKAAKSPTTSAVRAGGGCAMLSDSEKYFATLPADDVMACD